MKTETPPALSPISDDSFAHALAVLGNGGLVAVPTETVYGLAADATNGKAVARIFEAKGRPQFNPLICHVCSIDMAAEFAEVNDDARALMDAFWPGPLTLVLPLKKSAPIHPLVSADLDTIALRQPCGTMAKLVHALDRPLAAPSANTSGKISPTTAQAVYESLGNKVDFIIDNGPCSVGLESTIAKVDAQTLTLLRPGSITLSDLKKMSHLNLLEAAVNSSIQAPGMLASHYAPNAAMALNATSVREDDALLAFGPKRIDGASKAKHVCNLSTTGDLIEAAANLFSMMSELDKKGAARIVVEPIPADGIGAAINDRLARAAAPRGDTNG